jgi:putative ABC transport system permease protein
MSDVDALKNDSRVTAAAGIIPEYDGFAQLVNGSTNSIGRAVGTDVNYPAVRDQTLARGEWFSETDISGTKLVVVLGANQAKTLFGDDDPINKQVRISRTAFTVVGVMTRKGGTGFGSVDDQVYMPITTVQSKLLGPFGSGSLGTSKSVSRIVMKAKDSKSVEQLISQATDLLREQHKIQGADDFTVTNQQDQLQSARDQQNTLNIFLIVIASISLFVGGIGIMNIMLVTVTERTREIGIRKAIGAKPNDILLQFMIESITLCLVGGVFGVVAGIISGLIVNATFIHTVLSVQVMFLSVGFAVAVGLFFGIYPARRAARLHPIDALRYE